jgi:hypothetical protein
VLFSVHASADGTLVRANASYKSFAPIEVLLKAKEFNANVHDEEEEKCENSDDKGDKGKTQYLDKRNPTVDFRAEKRNNKTHRSTTDPGCRFVSKGLSGTGAYPGHTGVDPISRTLLYATRLASIAAVPRVPGVRSAKYRFREFSAANFLRGPSQESSSDSLS